jgi:HAE1 family hydrophobic/amphiphilic exporter-1
MGQAVIGGVITSSLLTLVVVPVVYCWLDNLAAWARRRFTKKPAPGTTVANPAVGPVIAPAVSAD